MLDVPHRLQGEGDREMCMFMKDAADKKKAKVGRRPAGHLYSRPASLHASAHACAAATALPPSLLPTHPLTQGAGDGG